MRYSVFPFLFIFISFISSGFVRWYDDDDGGVEQAATRIQAVFRGHKVRASMKQGDSSANSNNTKSTTSAIAQSNVSNDDPTQEELKAEFREDDKGK